MGDEQAKRAALTFDHDSTATGAAPASRAAIALDSASPRGKAESAGQRAPLTIDVADAPGIRSAPEPANDAGPFASVQAIRAVAEGAPKARMPPFASPSDHGKFKEWVDGATTHIEFLGLKGHLDRASNEEIKKRLSSLGEWEKKQRGQGAAGSNAFVKYLDTESGRARWKQLRDLAASPDPLASLRALIPQMEQDRALYALRAKAHGMVERDKVLDKYEHFFLLEFANELSSHEHVVLEPQDVIAAVKFWEPTLGAVRIEEARNPADLRFNVACLSSAFGEAAPYSIGEVHKVIVDDAPQFSRVLQAFLMEHVQNWLRNLELQLPADSSDKKVLQDQLRSARLVAIEKTPIAMWRFMWETGYPTLHLPRNIVLRDAKDLRKKIKKAEYLERAIEDNLLPLWCETVLKDPSLASFARTRGRTPKATARAFLWALGQGELCLGDAPVLTPQELVTKAVASRTAFDALTELIASGEIDDWLDALSYREQTDFSQLKLALAAHGVGRNAARLKAYRLVAELLVSPREVGSEASRLGAGLVRSSKDVERDAKAEGQVLPLFAGSTVHWVRTPEDLFNVVQVAPAAVEEALANGGLGAWLVSFGNAADTVAISQGWHESQRPSTQRAAQMALRIVGDLRLLVAGQVIKHLGHVFSVFEQSPQALAKAGGERVLLDWLNAYLQNAPSEVPASAIALAAAHDGSLESTQRLMWLLGYQALSLGSVTVTSVDTLRDLADADPCRSVRALGSGLAHEFCEVLQDKGRAASLRTLRSELNGAVYGEATSNSNSPDVVLAASRMAEALGATAGQLELGQSEFDLGELGPGDERSVTLRVRNTGERGALRCHVGATAGEFVLIEPSVASNGFTLAAGTEACVEVNVTLSTEAPPGRFAGHITLQALPGETREATVRMLRATPWMSMTLEVLLHVVLLAVGMVALRAVLGLGTESALTTSDSVVLRSIQGSDLTTFAWLGLALGVVGGATQVSEHGAKALAIGGLVGGLAGLLLGYVVLGLLRLLDGAGILLATRFSDLSPGTGAAHLGWLMLGAVLGVAAGVQQTVTRNYSSEWGVAAGLLVGAASFLLFV